MRNQGQVFKDGYIIPQQIIIHHPSAWKPHLHIFFPFGSSLCCGLAVPRTTIMSETHLWFGKPGGSATWRPGSGTGSQREANVELPFWGGDHGHGQWEVWRPVPAGILRVSELRASDANAESTEQVRDCKWGRTEWKLIESGSEERLLNDCLKPHCVSTAQTVSVELIYLVKVGLS